MVITVKYPLNDYFFIKKGGLIPGYIEEIERLLRKIIKTEVYENMIREYQSLNNVEERRPVRLLTASFLRSEVL